MFLPLFLPLILRSSLTSLVVFNHNITKFTDKIYKLDTRYWEHNDANVASLYFDFPPDVDPQAPIRIVKSFVKRYNIPYTDITPDIRDNDIIVRFVEKKNVMEARYTVCYAR